MRGDDRYTSFETYLFLIILHDGLLVKMISYSGILEWNSINSCTVVSKEQNQEKWRNHHLKNDDSAFYNTSG
ncbi:hypothetical protein [Chryseobacterium lactis]|uniref:hypothetical protein n=1 Tax=Chryseobacterium lactis TaxID=1241981 RepID=UPI001629B81D|nr:hypothetical protein [Chryseobacterium lactis]